MPELVGERLGADGERAARARSSVLSHARPRLADTTESFTAVKARSAALSVPADSRAHLATSSRKNPTDPPAMRIARSVNSLGGLVTLARMATSRAGTPRNRAVTALSRTTGGANVRFIRRSTALPARPT
jgi:hypothetical protein